MAKTDNEYKAEKINWPKPIMMKPPYSIPMETIWHGAKSLAYRLGAEYFGSTKRPSIECLNEQNCNNLCKDLR